MTTATKIEWATHSWNPIVGCSPKSTGCKNCYAMPVAARLAANPRTPHYAGTAKVVNDRAAFTGILATAPERTLKEPLRWRATPRRRVFVNSMGDLFHEQIYWGWLDRIWAVMALAADHDFLILTKRPAVMRAYLSHPDVQDRVARWRKRLMPELISLRYSRTAGAWPLPNVWLGVSVENQATADERVWDLLATLAARRFASYEPALGPVDWTKIGDPNGGHWRTFDALRGTTTTDHPVFGGSGVAPSKLDGIISGGESGPRGRTHHPDWHRHTRDQCAAAGVAYDFKQWGRWAPDPNQDHPLNEFVSLTGGEAKTLAGAALMAPIGKQRSGRLLDGRTHNAFTELPHVHV